MFMTVSHTRFGCCKRKNTPIDTHFVVTKLMKSNIIKMRGNKERERERESLKQ